MDPNGVGSSAQKFLLAPWAHNWESSLRTSEPRKYAPVAPWPTLGWHWLQQDQASIILEFISDDDINSQVILTSFQTTCFYYGRSWGLHSSTCPLNFRFIWLWSVAQRGTLGHFRWDSSRIWVKGYHSKPLLHLKTSYHSIPPCRIAKRSGVTTLWLGKRSSRETPRRDPSILPRRILIWSRYAKHMDGHPTDGTWLKIKFRFKFLSDWGFNIPPPSPWLPTQGAGW